MSSWHSYGSIYNLGHRAVKELLTFDVVVEEKVDGSQFSFGVIDGKLKIRSKGREFEPGEEDDIFKPSVATVVRLFEEGKLRNGWTYRGEAFKKPKHNALAYERIPKDHILLFDIAEEEEDYLSPVDKHSEARYMGLETVPVLYDGPGHALSLEKIQGMLETTSILGGQKIEGVVIKAYGQFSVEKKTLMGKHVREEFKELNSAAWASPGRKDIVEALGEALCTEARWMKAVQHLREAGLITDSPKDIGPLFKEISADVEREEQDRIKDTLYAHFRKDILKYTTKGLPEFYKKLLLEKQFAEKRDVGRFFR